MLGLDKPHPSSKLTLTETLLVTRLVVLRSLPDLTPTLYTCTRLVVLHSLPDNPTLYTCTRLVVLHSLPGLTPTL